MCFYDSGIIICRLLQIVNIFTSQLSSAAGRLSLFNSPDSLVSFSGYRCEYVSSVVLTDSCPNRFEISKMSNPISISILAWEREISMKEIILRDAKICAYAAGNVDHFKYLMKRLGYVFKKDAWMEVQAPGFRWYRKTRDS